MIQPGNAGDAVINYSTLELFKDLNIKYKIINKGKYKNKNIIISGGGNFVNHYNDVNKFIQNNHEYNNILLLPCTINNHINTLKKLKNNINIFVREKKSYDHVLKYFKYPKNLFLSDDMAFYININKFIKYNNNNNEKYDILNAFRTDIEKTNIKIPKNNIDISKKFEIPNYWENENLIYIVAMNFINYINNFKLVNTNRLHVGIISTLLIKEVNLYDNNYGKNNDVYNFSMKNKYKNIKFI